MLQQTKLIKLKMADYNILHLRSKEKKRNVMVENKKKKHKNLHQIGLRPNFPAS